MSDSRIIKKYPNRRLYDTETSTYITLSQVKDLVMSCTEFRIVDAKTGEDITRSILLQIILEQEGHQGSPLFSSEMLAEMIRFYGNAMQGVIGSFLEKSIHAFTEMQQKFQEQARSIYGEAPKMNSEVWNQLFKNSPQGMPNAMSKYLEQSANMFLEAQEQMRKQAMSFFGAANEEKGEAEPAPHNERS